MYGSNAWDIRAWKAEEVRQHYMEWQQEEFIHGCVQHELDAEVAEVAELERCQTQFEAQCGGEA
jgi:hypothetical protein